MIKRLFFLFLIFWASISEEIKTDYPIYTSSVVNLKVAVNSTNGWDLSDLYYVPGDYNGNLEKKRVTSFKLEGTSPCFTQDPSLLSTLSFIHRDNKEILDFATIGDYLYYVTSEKIARISLLKINTDPDTLIVKETKSNHYDYIDVFNLTDGHIMLLLRDSSIYFSYIILENPNTPSEEIRQIKEPFERFQGDMKVAYNANLFFIPTRTRGYKIYHYARKNQSLELIYENDEDFLNVRDIAIRPGASSRNVLGYIIVFDKGVVPFTFNTSSKTPTYQEPIQEFVHAKSITWSVYERQDSVVLILEGSDEASRIYTLSVDPKDHGNLTYDAAKLIDGVARYGNIEGKYASIVLSNSVYLTEVHRKSDNVYKYINNPGVNHAKMFRHDARYWMIYTKESNIVGDYIVGTNGFLLCDIGPKETTYKFSILGHSQVCWLDNNNNPVKNCYYEAKIILEVIGQSIAQSIEDIKKDGKLYGIIIGLVLIGLILFLVLLIIRYRNANNRLYEYQQMPLTSAGAGADAGTGNKLSDTPGAKLP